MSRTDGWYANPFLWLGAMPTLAVGMLKRRKCHHMPTASVGMAPVPRSFRNRNQLAPDQCGFAFLVLFFNLFLRGLLLRRAIPLQLHDRVNILSVGGGNGEDQAAGVLLHIDRAAGEDLGLDDAAG